MHIIAGLYKNRTIQAPKGLQTRPTSARLREALFNICQGIGEGECFLDLFAGSGAMGFEALSRGASSATFVDNTKESIRCIQTNIEVFNVKSSSEVIYGDVFEVLHKLAKKGKTYEIIYADPPYELIHKDKESALSYSARVLAILDDLIEKKTSLLSSNGDLFLEDAAKAVPNIDTLSLKHLVLKSSRELGRSTLQHYKIRDSL